jgi:hypothetical protein
VNYGDRNQPIYIHFGGATYEVLLPAADDAQSGLQQNSRVSPTRTERRGAEGRWNSPSKEKQDSARLAAG